jgi:single-stranded DNA-binding protein
MQVKLSERITITAGVREPAEQKQMKNGKTVLNLKAKVTSTKTNDKGEPYYTEYLIEAWPNSPLYNILPTVKSGDYIHVSGEINFIKTQYGEMKKIKPDTFVIIGNALGNTQPQPLQPGNVAQSPQPNHAQPQPQAPQQQAAPQPAPVNQAYGQTPQQQPAPADDDLPF